MGFELASDYNDVSSRLRDLREKYPTATLQQVDLKFIDFAGKSWVVYTAACYRTPDDERPGIGTAWEPVPGKTPYTKDSELQNSETAAWGRAILAALAADAKKGVASAEEVRNRQADREAPEPSPLEAKRAQVLAYARANYAAPEEFASDFAFLVANPDATVRDADEAQLDLFLTAKAAA
jgi:hypothetical protein